MDGPLPRWSEDTCLVCPAQLLGPGQFDVVERPGPRYRYDKQAGWRTDPDGVAVCVHPYRVGMAPGRYASAAQQLPDLTGPLPDPAEEALELPVELADLEGWLVARLRVVHPDWIFIEVTRAEREAAQRFAPGEVVTALRRVLSRELARR